MNRSWSSLVSFAALWGLLTGSTCAQVLTDVPENAKEIRIDQWLGRSVPRDLVFLDESGAAVPFSQLFDGRRPVLLTLNYSDCPGLCVAQLDGLVEGIADLPSLQLEKDFLVVSVSINPQESSAKLARMKDRYVSQLSRDHDPAGWKFLTGSAASIRQLTDAVGFRYSYDAQADRYNHAAAAVLLSPAGVITRYLLSVSFEPETLRLSLVEASDGQIGSFNDQWVLWCFHYDANANRYSADAKRILAFAAGAFVLIGTGISIPFWFKRSSPSAATAEEPEIHSSTHSSDTLA